MNKGSGHSLGGTVQEFQRVLHPQNYAQILIIKQFLYMYLTENLIRHTLCCQLFLQVFPT